MSYPNWKAERPFAMGEKQRRAIAAMSREQLEESMLREMERRGLWEWSAIEAGVPPDAQLELLRGPRPKP